MKLSARLVFFTILFLGLFLMTLRPIADPDFWWHLRAGQLIYETRAIPHTDPFSFSRLGMPWITHEWLSELFIYFLYSIGNYHLLILVFSSIITFAFILSYLRSPNRSRPYIAGFSLLLGALATAPTWGVRPQMISLLLTSLFLYLLDLYQVNNKSIYIFPLPAITLIWVNLHAGYFLGLVVIAIHIVGRFLEILKASHLHENINKQIQFSPVLRLCAILGICILAVFINPNGLNILIYPFQTLFSKAMQQFIVEWFSPDFHKLEWQPLAWLILGIIGFGMLGRKSFSPTKILLTLFFGLTALQSMRHVPLFAIAVIPIFAEQVDGVLSIPININHPGKFVKWLFPIVLLSMLFVIYFRFFQVLKGQTEAETKNFPKHALDWFQQNELKGKLFNSYGWGGYLIWRLYPENLVFIDGRADLYGDAFIYDYMKVYRAQPGWADTLTTLGIEFVIVEPTSGLADALQQNPKWYSAYSDTNSVIYLLK